MSDTAEGLAPVRSDVAAEATPPLRGPGVGDLVGPYRLVRLIGAGAVGCVWEAEHEKLGRRAALKLLDPALARRPAARARFFAEALAVNRIHDPHIVEVTDTVEDETRPALVMELLEGQSLREAMDVGPMAPERFLPILAQVCEGLAAAHAAGFVHRDLKPDNVFLCARVHGDFVKLLDFGLATTFSRGSRRTDGRGDSSGVRRRPGVNSFVGSPAYVSPEQAAGASVDHTTDLYAVGVILYELVTGRVPFEGTSLAQYVVQHASAPVPRLPTSVRATPLGRTLDDVARRCLAKEPYARFSSATELGELFEALALGELPVVATLSSIRERRARPPRLAFLAAGLGFAAAVAAGVIATRARTVAPPAPVAVVAPAAPPAPAHVSIAFESEPTGAEVRTAATHELLGVTPFRRAFARGGPDEIVEVVHVGFATKRLAVSLAAEGRVRAALEPVAAQPRSRSHRRVPRRLDVEKTIDPFHK
ncbi:MAG TPA: serine/threonine-protein kinase [Polyangia bacterium]|nr:serine/threonine-protein kinase [Polyangia bacterium]